MEELPPLPEGIRTLTNEERDRLVAQHPSVWNHPDTACLTCDKAGTFTMRGPDGPVECRCNCGEQWIMHRYLLCAGIGLAYQRLGWMDLDDQIPDDVVVGVDDYLQHASRYVGSGMGMMLTGPVGTGKTLLGVLLLKRLIAQGYSGYFTQFTEMIDAYTSGWRNEEEKAWFTRTIRNADVLMVDDIGREHHNVEVIESMFDRVIRSRVADAKPTIITTNMKTYEFDQKYGTNVMSLLSQVSFPYNVSGSDFRRKARDINISDARQGIVQPIRIA